MPIARRFARSCSGLLLALAVTAPDAAPAQESIAVAASPTRDARPAAVAAAAADSYRIGPADVLKISVWKNESLTHEVPVRPDGMISFPLVNEIRAAGLTPMQLRDLLTRRLASFVANPEVSVVVLEIHSFAVSVLGEVKTPGRYELKNEATVLDVLALAGGVTEYASRSRIFVLRNSRGAPRKIYFDYDRFVASPSSRAVDNISLEPGDVVVVP